MEKGATEENGGQLVGYNTSKNQHWLGLRQWQQRQEQWVDLGYMFGDRIGKAC